MPRAQERAGRRGVPGGAGGACRAWVRWVLVWWVLVQSLQWARGDRLGGRACPGVGVTRAGLCPQQ